MGGHPSLPDPHGRPWLHPSEIPPPVVGPSRRHRWVVPATAGALALVGAFAFLGASSDSGRRHRLEAVTNQVVSVVAWHGPQARYGSAVVASPGVLLTSANLVADASGLEVVVPGGARLTARVVGIDPARGLAVMECEDGWVAPPVTPPTALAQEGATLVLVTADTAGGPALYAKVSGVGQVIKMNRDVPAGMEGAALMGITGRLVGFVAHVGNDGSGARAVPITVLDRIVADMLETDAAWWQHHPDARP